MERWQNKVAVVTGASSGIGAAIVKDLIKANLIVVGLARRVEKIEELRKDIPIELQKNLHALKCDITSETDVTKSFEWICENHGGVDILINNAGCFATGNLVTMETSLIRQTLDTNIMGIVYATRQAFKSMQDRQVAGHMILINSIAGHQIVTPIADGPSINIYPASKYGVTAMTEIYRQEFQKLGTKIKITSISPGLTETDIIPQEWRNLENIGILQPEDISGGVLYALSTPPHVQVNELTILPL